MREVLAAHQGAIKGPSRAIKGPSRAIRGHQGPSGAITTHLASELRCPEDEGHELIIVEAPHAV